MNNMNLLRLYAFGNRVGVGIGVGVLYPIHVEM